ncbi:129_t:CDS:1 [Acaulospora morrowiae]|uniref:129_t:CDS:1 n=1 Tax=Acaulospora morrowiae TaxID=94023 RepID=A0A9N9ES88_9GLOM|nr:129_t:CDS:1 [Acaulospora morrowiae]
MTQKSFQSLPIPNEEECSVQRKFVDDLIEDYEYPFDITKKDVDKLIEPSWKRGQLSRPNNSFIIFRKFIRRVFKQEKNNKMKLSRYASKKWEEWGEGTSVPALFNAIFDLATMHHKFLHPDYKYQPGRKNKGKSHPSPEMDNLLTSTQQRKNSLSDFSSLEMDTQVEATNDYQAENTTQVPCFSSQNDQFLLPSSFISEAMDSMQQTVSSANDYNQQSCTPQDYLPPEANDYNQQQPVIICIPQYYLLSEVSVVDEYNQQQSVTICTPYLSPEVFSSNDYHQQQSVISFDQTCAQNHYLYTNQMNGLQEIEGFKQQCILSTFNPQKDPQ